jgi:putative tryptophan/tyrosine transport system substrate-binding protein
MQRREFITLIGGAATWPFAAHAQSGAMPVIGFLCSGSPESDAPRVAAVQRGLNESGYVEGRNAAAEYRWAEDQYDRLQALAIDLARQPVSVIVAIGTTPAALAAKAATSTIPIVFTIGGDPVEIGLVAALNKPGGNVTGVSFLNRVIVAKQVELLHEAVPSGAVIGFLVNPTNPYADFDMRDAQAAADALGLKLIVVRAAAESDFEKAFATLVQNRVGALLVAGNLFFNDQRARLVAMATRVAMPAMFPWREAAAAGGLMSYGANIPEAFRQAGVYIGRILKGEKPADLPVQRSTKVELVINLKTAKALGLTFPLSLLGRADEVIE